MNLFVQAMQAAFGEPTKKQQKFFESQRRYVGCGGAKFGGKSHGVRAKATIMAYENYGINMLIVRRTLPELRENHVLRLQEAYSKFPEKIRPTYRESDKEFWYPGGSRLKLGYCDKDADVLQYQGQEYDIVFLDEATTFSEYQFYWINACVGRRKGVFPQRTYITCNPGGVGHGWVKRLFIDKDYRNTERKEDYDFIPAYAWDNTPALMQDKEYVAEIEGLKKKYGKKEITEKIAKEAIWSASYIRDNLGNLPQELQEAWLYGNWNVYAGQYFGEFSEQTHCIEPFKIPSTWRKTAAIDYGLDCFAVLFFAIDEDGQVYCYRDHEEKNLRIEVAAERFHDLKMGDRVDAIYAPDDLWSRGRETGIPQAETFAKCGMPLIKTSRAREHGWAQVKQYLGVPRNDKGERGTPRMVFFNTCNYITKNLPLLQSDRHNPKDVAKEPHDITHTPDALRAWCVSRQLGTEIIVPEKPDPFGLNKPCDDENIPEEYLIGGFHN